MCIKYKFYGFTFHISLFPFDKNTVVILTSKQKKIRGKTVWKKQKRKLSEL